MSEKKSNSRTRNFATVVYPESAPENWQTILADLKIPAFISPLHDSDVNANGEPKKPHYHVMFMYDGVKTEEQVSSAIAEIGGVGCEKINSVRSYARYLCHLDNPDKHQYNPEDVKQFSGADYFSCIGSVADKYKAIREMIVWCHENGVTEYADLLFYCMENRDDWFRVLCDCGTYVMKEYLKSRHYQKVGVANAIYDNPER